MFMVSVGEANNFYAALNDCELATLGKVSGREPMPNYYTTAAL